MIKAKIVIIAVIALMAAPISLPAMTLAATATTATTKKDTPFYYGVWLPFWQAQPGEEDIAIHLNSLNEVSPFSYDVNSDGTLVDDLNIDNGSWNGWFSAVKELGVKIIPTIAWFDGPSIYNLLSNTPNRQAEETMMAQLAKTEDFNGIDIDFESMLPATRPYFSLFIEGLSNRLHAEGKTLTCSVVPRTPPQDIYTVVPATITYPENYSVLNEYCDEVRLEVYDEETTDLTLDASKGNGTFYAPVTDPDWAKAVISLAEQSINPRKIMLGIPTYGYEYEVSWGLGTPGVATSGQTTYQRVRSFSFFQAMDRAESMGIEPTRNSADELSFTYTSSTYILEPPILISTVPSAIEPTALMTTNPNATTTFYVSFPDAQSEDDEINLAKQMGLRGVMFFKADGQMDPAIWDEMTQ
jgi:spore germination protein YaaH